MSNHRSIVVGHRGQDGSLLCQLLRSRGDALLGLGRQGTEHLTDPAAEALPASLEDPRSIDNLVRRFAPTQVYYVAAHHRSSERPDAGLDVAADFNAGLLVNVQGPIAFLDAIRRHAPACRFFYASSSLVFGHRTPDQRQDEATPHTPQCEYGQSKSMGQLACRRFREQARLFASVGILYNHESELRGPTFLTRRIIDAALRIRAGSSEQLVLGSLDAVTDWGYAPDFVDAFRRILDVDEPGEFIVATGQPHTVRDFVRVAFTHLGLDWQRHVRVDSARLGRAPSARVGDPGKLARLTGWKPTIAFEEMIRLIVDRVAADLDHAAPRNNR